LRRMIGLWAYNLTKSDAEGVFSSMKRALADKLVYSKFRNALGGRFRGMICGGAALDAELCQFFLKIGVPVYQGYGLTETSPVIAANFLGNNVPGTVGKPFPGVEVKIAKGGEIVTRSTSVMRGYYKNTEATRKVLDSEGWFYTGDCGEFDENGNLKVTGRIKEILKTSTGKMVIPIPIEHAISKHPLVDMAMVIAEGKRFVSALFFPDFEFLQRMKKKQGKEHVSHEEFLDSGYVREQISMLVAQANGELNDWEKVQKWRFVPSPLSIEGGDLTPTLKVRRNVIVGKYKELVDEMYAENHEEVGERV
jgi:long-chain acyl-CoA synthetase